MKREAINFEPSYQIKKILVGRSYFDWSMDVRVWPLPDKCVGGRPPSPLRQYDRPRQVRRQDYVGVCLIYIRALARRRSSLVQVARGVCVGRRARQSLSARRFCVPKWTSQQRSFPSHPTGSFPRLGRRQCGTERHSSCKERRSHEDFGRPLSHVDKRRTPKKTQKILSMMIHHDEGSKYCGEIFQHGPISLLTAIMDTIEVSGRISAASSSKLTRPFTSGLINVTSNPSLSFKYRQESKTHLCSICDAFPG